MKKKLKRYVFCGIGILILCTIFIQAFNPLRRSEETIRKSLLKQTPIGTDKQIIIEKIRNTEEFDALDGSGNTTIDDYLGSYTSFFVLDFFLDAYTGSSPMEVGVFVDYVFNENSKLVDISVLKHW